MPHLSFQLVPLPLGLVLTYLIDLLLLDFHHSFNLHLYSLGLQLLHFDEFPAPNSIPLQQELVLDIIALALRTVYPSELTLHPLVALLVVSILWVEPQSADPQLLRFIHQLHSCRFILILLHFQQFHLHFQQPLEPRSPQHL